MFVQQSQIHPSNSPCNSKKLGRKQKIVHNITSTHHYWNSWVNIYLKSISYNIGLYGPQGQNMWLGCWQWRVDTVSDVIQPKNQFWDAFEMQIRCNFLIVIELLLRGSIQDAIFHIEFKLNKEDISKIDFWYTFDVFKMHLLPFQAVEIFVLSL